MDVGALEKLLSAGRDDATLRYALGGAYLKQGDAEAAIRHLNQAVSMDPLYSAAWKLLAQSQIAANEHEQARQSYARGIEAATERGDAQAAREMQVFLRRLDKRAGT